MWNSESRCLLIFNYDNYEQKVYIINEVKFLCTMPPILHFRKLCHLQLYGDTANEIRHSWSTGTSHIIWLIETLPKVCTSFDEQFVSYWNNDENLVFNQLIFLWSYIDICPSLLHYVWIYLIRPLFADIAIYREMAEITLYT